MKKVKRQAPLLMPKHKMIEVANSYKFLSDFVKNEPYVVSRSQCLGIYKEITNHMIRKCNKRLSSQAILKIANNYSSYMEFRVFEPKAYRDAGLNGIYHKVKELFKYEHSFWPVGENSIRLFLEEVFNQKFPKKRIICNNLKNKKIFFRKLELDGFCEKLNIAFEHQGIQHYTKNHHIYKDKNLKLRDTVKKNMCKKLGIKLIVILDIVNILKFNENKIKQVLIKEFNRLNIDIPANILKCKINFILVVKNKKLSEKDIVSIAKKSNNRKSFIKQNLNLYKKLIRIKKWNSICQAAWGHDKMTKTIWTKKKIKKIAKNFLKRSDFKRKELQCYRAAIKKGILDEVCSHMPKRCPRSMYTNSHVYKNSK